MPAKKDKEILARRKKNQEIARKKYGTPKCKKGQIVRAGYVRTSKSGKKTIVPPTCIKDRGNKGKGPKLPFVLEKYKLRRYGYSSKDTVKKRQAAIDKAINKGKYDPLSVERHLVAISTMHKNTNPDISKRMLQDVEYIRVKYLGKNKRERKSTAKPATKKKKTASTAKPATKKKKTASTAKPATKKKKTSSRKSKSTK